MAASATVPQLPPTDNSRASRSLKPQHGVMTLFGYGIRVQVQRGHLHVEDGIGATRRTARLARIGHNLKRLIVTGSDGVVSLAALRWLADQKAAFAMLDRDGTVLAVTGPVRPSDVRLRRAQGVAHQSGAALVIARGLITRKLLEQQKVAESALSNASAGAKIATFQKELNAASTLDDVRRIEAQAALVYWGAWRGMTIPFPRQQLARVPEHWRTFTARASALTGTSRLATDPVNAILNYLYAVLETESRLSAAAVGLDPGLGVLHADTIARDNLACDLMEPVRPLVDAYVLTWLRTQPLGREWFFETGSGNCRLMGALTEHLARTAPVWARAVAPIAEDVAKQFWTNRAVRPSRELPTALTQLHRRVAQGGRPIAPPPKPATPPKVCQICGASLTRGTHCRDCSIVASTEAIVAAAKKGRALSQQPKAQAKRTATRLRHAQAEREWRTSDLTSRMTIDHYDRWVRPRLKGLTNRTIILALQVSQVYAIRIRHGRVRPHPRHWATLAALVGQHDQSPTINETASS